MYRKPKTQTKITNMLQHGTCHTGKARNYYSKAFDASDTGRSDICLRPGPQHGTTHSGGGHQFISRRQLVLAKGTRAATCLILFRSTIQVTMEDNADSTNGNDTCKFYLDEQRSCTRKMDDAWLQEETVADQWECLRKWRLAS